MFYTIVLSDYSPKFHPACEQWLQIAALATCSDKIVADHIRTTGHLEGEQVLPA